MNNLIYVRSYQRKTHKVVKHSRHQKSWLFGTTNGSVTFLLILAFFIGIVGYSLKQPKDMKLQSPVVVTKAVVEATSSAQIASTSGETTKGGQPIEPEYTQEEIKSYIKTIFRNEYQVACAVFTAESGLGTGEIKPEAENNWNLRIEHSIGTAQINLYRIVNGQLQKIHWDKVPGKTKEEKIEWLKNPMNNILLAHYIKSSRGNWEAWSSYINGSYEKYLKNCK